MRTLLSILAGFTGFFLVGCGQNTLPNKPTTPSTKVEFLYAASVVTNFGAGGIETYQIDSATHDISALTGPSFDFDFAVNFFPIGLVSDSSHQFLLSAFVTGPFSAEVQSYQRDSDGGLTLVTDMPVPGAIPVAIAMDPQNRFFYFVGEGTAPMLSVWGFNSSSGALTLISSLQLQPSTAGPGGVSADPSGKFLYVSLQQGIGNTGVAELSIGSDGTVVQNGIVPLAGVPFPGPVFASDTNVYVGNQTGGVLAFSIASDSGLLTPLAGSPFATNSEKVLAFLKFNNFLYVGTQSQQNPGPGGSLIQDPATLFAFEIQSDGTLQPVVGSPFQPAFNAQSLAMIDSFLYVGDELNINGFQIDLTSGALTTAFSHSNGLSNLGLAALQQ